MAKFVTRGASGKERYFIDARQVTQQEFDTALAVERAALPQIAADPEAAGNRPWTKPILSKALQYHPRQVEAARASFQKRGLSPDLIRPSGEVELPSRDIRKKVLRATGMHDNQGGYGD